MFKSITMTISFATQKGGTGKTTSSISIASGLARKGKKVLLIDIDQQANASDILHPDYSELETTPGSENNTIYRTIIDRKPLPIYKSKIENLDIVPSHILLSSADAVLSTAMDHKESRLKKELAKVKDNYDYVIIDCPPALGWLTLNAFVASDKVIVVVSPGRFELTSITQIGKTIELVQTDYEHDVELWGFLYNRKEPTITSKDSLLALRENFPEMVFKTVIPKNTEIEKAHLLGIDIFEHNPNSPYAIAINSLINELFENEQ
ncbi:MAG: AAA family ATPase [Caldilineaceae bacterium]